MAKVKQYLKVRMPNTQEAKATPTVTPTKVILHDFFSCGAQ
jgi:hypothetical protein